jgi:hypothetical protein
MLRLGEWDITLYIVDPDDVRLQVEKQDPEDDVYGMCLWDGDLREADILIADPALIDHHKGAEHTLIHELLHLVVNPILEEQGAEGVERLINHITRSLLHLRAGDVHTVRRIVDEKETVQGT